MQLHRPPLRISSCRATERLLLGVVLPSSLLLLIELMLAAHDGRGTQRGQARTGKTRHNDEVTRLGHVAARSRRSGHRFGAILPLVLVVGVALTAVLALLLSALGLVLVLLLSERVEP